MTPQQLRELLLGFHPSDLELVITNMGARDYMPQMGNKVDRAIALVEFAEARGLLQQLESLATQYPESHAASAGQHEFALQGKVNLPPALDPDNFLLRDDLLQAIQDDFRTHPVVALTGLGGVGKSAAALAYAYAHADDYQALLFLLADSDNSLQTSLAHIWQIAAPGRKPPEPADIRADIDAWLAAHDRWLLLIDNADELERARPLIPNNSRGHVLLTTQDQRQPLGFGRAVEPMRGEQGVEFLLRRARLLPRQRALSEAGVGLVRDAGELVSELDGLTLSLEIAAAVVREEGFSLQEFLQDYRRAGRDYRQEETSGVHRHPGVSRTFDLAFARVSAGSAASADLLRVAAALSASPLPQYLFGRGKAYLGEALQEADNPVRWKRVICSDALRYALMRDVSLPSDRSVLQIHREVQQALRDRMAEEGVREEWERRAGQALNAAFPDPDYANWAECERLLPHVLVCAQAMGSGRWKAGWEEEWAGQLLNATAYFLDDQARYGEAEPLYQQALSIWQKSLPEGHPNIATSLNNLGLLYRNQGRYEEAEPLYQQALTIWQKAFPKGHPTIAFSFNNLGLLYSIQGRYEEAEPLYRQALTIWQKAYPEDHPLIATSLNNLAELYRNQGRYEEAEPLYRQALTIWQKALGAQHPHIATSLNNLGLLYHNQARYEEAEPLFKQALAILHQALPEGHPDTAQSLNNLAELYRSQGRYEEAEPLYQQALAICQKALGAQHPQTRAVSQNYRLMLLQAEKFAEAEALEPGSVAWYRAQQGQ